jgi:hypothetical protein
MDGINDLIDYLEEERYIKYGILTRNSEKAVNAFLKKLS